MSFAMVEFPFNLKKLFSRSFEINKRVLGIDIGTSSIKIVELSGTKERQKLENYGELKAEAIFQKSFRSYDKESGLAISSRDTARAITAILSKAEIKTKEAIFSIPDFSTFFTWYSLPVMTKEELPQAVQYEARQHIPVPLNEVTLDWQIIEGSFVDKEKTSSRLKVLLVAVPNEIIHRYQEIAQYCKINIRAMEPEVFGLARSLTKGLTEPVFVLDIGAQSTTISIVEKGIVRMSHSFDTAGIQLTRVLVNSLGLEYKEAEKLKEKYGINSDFSSSDGALFNKKEASPQSVRQILLPFIDLIITELEKISQNFARSNGKEVKKVILAGGSVSLPGLVDYFSQRIKTPLEVANPFLNLYYPPILEDNLRKMGPSYAIAVGIAMRELES